MGKTSACIKMIQVLSSRDCVSTKELADILETNERNIREYIKEIETSGYYVTSERGIYGGYKLDKSEMMPSVKLTPEERAVLQKANEFLSNCADFLDYKEYLSTIGKIMSSFNSGKEVTPMTMIDRFPLAMSKSDLQKRYQALDECRDEQLKCQITYSSAGGNVKKHVIHPYKQFVYNNNWFVLAWNESVNNFGYFKLNRIEDIVKTKAHFTILSTYDESKYLDSFGMKQNGEWYTVELEIKNVIQSIEERVYGKNQKVEHIDEKTVKLTCDMQNKAMIKSFVLSHGANCKVLSPEWLISDVKAELWTMLNSYEE